MSGSSSNWGKWRMTAFGSAVVGIALLSLSVPDIFRISPRLIGTLKVSSKEANQIFSLLSL